MDDITGKDVVLILVAWIIQKMLDRAYTMFLKPKESRQKKKPKPKRIKQKTKHKQRKG